jgi:adenylate cyclase
VTARLWRNVSPVTEDERLIALADAGDREGFEERLSQLRVLASLGASDAELEQASRSPESVSVLALRVALRKGTSPAAQARPALRGPRPSADELQVIWRALGFPDSPGAAPVEPGLIEAVEVFAALGHDFLGAEGMIAIARVLGFSASRLAQALADAFRVEFEMPLRTAGVPYAEVVRRYANAAEEGLPRLIDAFGAVFREHLLRQAAGTWSYDHEDAVARRQVVVAFADLVGYTAMSRTLSGVELASMVEGFEAALFEGAAGHDMQLVKLIGDGAMIVASSPDAACRFALELVARIGSDSRLPTVRVALAGGSAVSLAGDFYGDVVNVAARLLLVAEPSAVVCDQTVRDGTRAPFTFLRLPARPMKGLDEPAVAYRLLSSS